jgi:hypothetical protein
MDWRGGACGGVLTNDVTNRWKSRVNKTVEESYLSSSVTSSGIQGGVHM